MVQWPARDIDGDYSDQRSRQWQEPDLGNIWPDFFESSYELKNISLNSYWLKL
jgi:hypothetical protein